MAIVAVEKPLREKLGDDGVDALVRLINQSQENQKQDLLEFLSEKFERRLAEENAKLRAEIAELRSEFKSDIAELRTELKADGADLRTEVASTRADLIRWMSIFWVGQIGVIFAMLLALLK